MARANGYTTMNSKQTQKIVSDKEGPKTIDKNNWEDRKKRTRKWPKRKIEMKYVYRSISCIGHVVVIVGYGFGWVRVVMWCDVPRPERTEQQTCKSFQPNTKYEGKGESEFTP